MKIPLEVVFTDDAREQVREVKVRSTLKESSTVGLHARACIRARRVVGRNTP